MSLLRILPDRFTRGLTPDASLCALLVASLIAARFLAWTTLPIFDDAFITLRYARNLAGGLGFLYNAGEPVLGTTAPGFGLLAALFHAVGLPMPGSVVAFNILCDAGTLALTVTFLLRLGNRTVALLFAAAFSASPILARVCVGGMEVNLFLLAGLGAVWLYHARRPLTAVAIAAAACFLRPEGVLLVALLCLQSFSLRRPWLALRMCAVAVLAVAPGLLLLAHLYGDIVPQSVAAKAMLPPGSRAAMLRQLLAADPLAVLLLPFAVIGGLAAWARGGIARMLVVWGGAQVLAYTIARPNPWPWYGEVVYYVVTLGGAFGLAEIVSRVRRIERAMTGSVMTSLAAAMPVLVWAVLVIGRGGDDVSDRVYAPLRRWCVANLDSGSTVAAYDIGALGYFSDATVYDLAGLVWPEAVRMRWDYEEIVRRHRPDYLYVFATRETARWVSRPAIAGRYRPIARFSRDGLADLAIDSASFGEGWRQDYILFRRRTR